MLILKTNTWNSWPTSKIIVSLCKIGEWEKITNIFRAPIKLKKMKISKIKGVIESRKSNDRQYNDPKKKKNDDLQNTTQKTDIATWTPLKTGGKLGCSGRMSSSYSISDARRITLVTNPVINREWWKDRIVNKTNTTYLWSFVRRMFHNDKPSHSGDGQTFEVMTSTCTLETFGLVASLLATILYQRNYDRNHKSGISYKLRDIYSI
jgi:hypothetical protein